MTAGFGQPNPFATVLFGSLYFWSLLFVWTALLLDGFRCFRRVPMAV